VRDNTDVVAKVKNDLAARGMDFTGPCGAFSITRRVAWALREEGAGLLQKTSGNNCEGCAVDVVFYRDGTWVDCLVNSETENRPAWQVGQDKLDPGRWIAPTQMDPDVPPNPAPAPAPVPDGGVLDKLSTDVEHLIDVMEELDKSVAGLSQRIDGLVKSGLRLRL
jgi:hypothetical protein